jgi:hypothetical protein
MNEAEEKNINTEEFERGAGVKKENGSGEEVITREKEENLG